MIFSMIGVRERSLCGPQGITAEGDRDNHAIFSAVDMIQSIDFPGCVKNTGSERFLRIAGPRQNRKTGKVCLVLRYPLTLFFFPSFPFSFWDRWSLSVLKDQ